ncbi:hypothetical protein GCM10027160_03240 [Streptomyces calidiresistens]|uniref:TniQ domain-containing protein n=1 Tax=Streptomyces calidiresistens TaxID=1485586 RepID=A0A7W3XVF0_9ACTN|nr:TniQ family protein [Streptomyces calidiresistens]MBB0228652.1 hypothetical protein [Streptomyces calidiresistens]
MSGAGTRAGVGARFTYDGRAVLIDPGTRHVNRRLLRGRAGGSRHCPACLEQTGGRWKLSWRLGWSFACLEHGCLPADARPARSGQAGRPACHPEPPGTASCGRHRRHAC